jgi:cytochrome c-type biogenesis protein CcmH/NrfG
MSTVMTPSRRLRVAASTVWTERSLTADVALGFVCALVLGTVAFVAGGGTSLSTNTWIEISLTVIGAGLAIAGALVSARGRAWGAVTLLLFVALTALTAASIGWSVQPSDSWVEANRTVSYLAAFGGAMALARIVPGRWAAIVGALAVLATVVSGYSLLAKVFPGTFDAVDQIGRLRLPFDYWNAVGLMAALGVPPCLWAGSRRGGGLISRALTVPAIGVLVVAIMMSLSRGALVIAVVGLVAWFALVSVRLRAVVVLSLGVAGGAVVSIWALSNHSLSHDFIALHARTAAGHTLGPVLLAMIAVLTAVGFASAIAMDRVAVPELVRRRVGIALVVLAALIPVAGVGAVAASSRGLTGTVSHAWNQLTSPNSGGAADVPGRLLATGSTRGRYWNEGLKVADHALFKGVGAGGFATAHTRYAFANTRGAFVTHAHSYPIETLADLGLIGLLLSLALLVSWSISAARAVVVRRWMPAEKLAERDGLITLLVVVIIFGLNSAIDWTWFIPGTAITALVCAGWLAGRGPLGRPVGRKPVSVTAGAIGAAALIGAVTLVVAWLTFQPLRSANADAAALTAIARGNQAAAFSDARAAASANPVSVEPLFELAALYQATGNDAAAITELQKAVALQPQNPQTWLTEGETLLALHRPAAALPALTRALELNVGSPQIIADIERAKAGAQPGLNR